jgi:hypothetical protein
VTTYAVPVAAGDNIMIEGEFPLTEAMWTQFLAVLSAMKPGLVSRDKSADAGAGDFLMEPPNPDEDA